MKKKTVLVSLLSLGVYMQALAATPSEIEYQLVRLLAEQEATFLNYSIGDDGRVYLMFGRSEPDWRIEKTLKALQSHPDFRNLVWSKSDSEYCSIR